MAPDARAVFAVVSGNGRSLSAGAWLRAARKACLVAGVATWSAAALAHQWYPKTCCNDQDCFPADHIERRGDGSLKIRTGPITVIVPPGFEASASRDNRVHVCVWRDGLGKYHARCVFLPGIG
jgi:hypothetical protein